MKTFDEIMRLQTKKLLNTLKKHVAAGGKLSVKQVLQDGRKGYYLEIWEPIPLAQPHIGSGETHCSDTAPHVPE